MYKRLTLRLASHVFFAIALSIIIGGCAASAFIDYKIKPDFPKNENQSVDLPGLSQPVKVYFDQAGVAHIDAANEVDLARAAGFVQARNRFFGMDMFRRFARGRVSELLGEQEVGVLAGTTIDVDLSMRGWGFDSAVAQDAADMSDEVRELMEAYTAGVNRALELYTPLEYRLLQVEPEAWKVEDSFALGRIVAWGITHNWHQETSRLLLALNVGLERAAEIYTNDYWRGGMTLPPMDADFPLPPAIAPELAEIIQPRPFDEATKGEKHVWSAWGHDSTRFTGASNAWVVAGERSLSGKSIVASDPHMSHFLPSFFYQQHLRCPELDVIGASIAGLPYVFIGHNRHVAWGATSAVADVIDLYVEKVNPDNPEEYLTPEGYKTFVKKEQIIRVRDGSKFIEKRFELRFTENGPVMNDMYPMKFPEWAPPVSIKWNQLSVAGSFASFRDANKAESVEELHKAFSNMRALANNIIAADDKGRIAAFSTGDIPIRKNHLGTFPVPGWLEKYKWQGVIESNQTPHGFSDSGFYANGNNLMRDPAHSDVFFNIDSAPSYRYDRISEMIEAKPKHDKDSFAAMHRDVKLLRASRVLPSILEDLEAAQGLSEMEKQALSLLKNWDYNATKDSAAAPIFYLTYREAIIRALKDEVDPHSYAFILSQRYSTNVADLWFDAKDQVVWDHRGTKDVESRPDAVIPAFKAAVAQMVEDQGDDPTAWQWGKLHFIHLKHFFGNQKALAGTVNLPRAAVGGGMDSVWKSHIDLGHPETPFRALAGPAYRMIVDLADMDHGWWVSDTGVSAWPSDPHYGDQHPLWLKGEYVPMISDWKEIQTKATGVMTLQ